jgi:hypothetical protein
MNEKVLYLEEPTMDVYDLEITRKKEINKANQIL